MAAKLPSEEQRAHLEILRQKIQNSEKIAAIKEIRTLASGLGLAEAKNLVEEETGKHGWNAVGFESICTRLSDYLDAPYTKEQFIGLVSAAYDAADTFFEDPLAAVLHALKNLQAKGGLKYVAARDQKFIDSI